MHKPGDIVLLYGEHHLVVVKSKYSMTLENIETGEIIITDQKYKDVKKIKSGVEKCLLK